MYPQKLIRRRTVYSNSPKSLIST